MAGFGLLRFRVLKKLLRGPVLVPLTFFTLFAFGLSVCTGGPRRSERNLAEGVVRIELAGKHFDIPVRYMYGRAMAYYGYWPTPKSGRTHVDYIDLTMLLPDLRPYYKEDDARWKELGHGDRVYVTFSSYPSIGGDVDLIKGNLDRYVKKGILKKEKVTFGLENYVEVNSSFGNKIYIKGGKNWIEISCRHKVPSPGCRVNSEYGDLGMSYSYSAKYVDKWEEVDNLLKEKFHSMLTYNK